MWASQSKILLSCNSQYLHVAWSAPDTVCLALCYLPGFAALCTFSHCLLSSVSWVNSCSLHRVFPHRCWGRGVLLAGTTGSSLWCLAGLCSNWTEEFPAALLYSWVRLELVVCPVLLPLLARAKPAAALLTGELPWPFLLECLLLLTHTSVGFTEPREIPQIFQAQHHSFLALIKNSALKSCL